LLIAARFASVARQAQGAHDVTVRRRSDDIALAGKAFLSALKEKLRLSTISLVICLNGESRKGEVPMTSKGSALAPAAGRATDQNLALQQVAAALARIDYGTIQLTVHNGRLVQLDVTERQRFSG
jgi:hypothetical protein